MEFINNTINSIDYRVNIKLLRTTAVNLREKFIGLPITVQSFIDEIFT